VVWKITEQQVLASAGLDAYVVRPSPGTSRWHQISANSIFVSQFLRFFKVAIKTLSVTLFFALVVIKPVHDAFPDSSDELRRNDTKHDNATYPMFRLAEDQWQHLRRNNDSRDGHGLYDHVNTDYLWMYLVFAYLFTVLAIYLLVTETQRIIAIRQEYLGSQATITDRTIRLSGIPKSLRSEDKIKDFLERLQIGKVQKITLCRNWQELDDKMAERSDILRKLEESWTVFLGRRRVERNMEALPIVQPSPPGPEIYQDEDETEDSERALNGHAQIGAVPYARERPMITVGSGFFGRNGRKVDAIDHYEETLKAIDVEIKELRQKEYEPTSLAFVTLDSVAACVSTYLGGYLKMKLTILVANGCSGCTRSFTNALDCAPSTCADRCSLEQYLFASLQSYDTSLVDHGSHNSSDNFLVIGFGAISDCAQP